MAWEIELKARIDRERYPSLLEQLHQDWGQGTYVEKHDEYWQKEALLCRLRFEPSSSSCLLTFKQRQKFNELEVNQENECSLSDGRVFENFLRLLGFHLYYKKIKTGWVFLSKNVTIELWKIENLGYFLELESIVHTEELPLSNLLQEKHQELLSFLESYGLTECIERRSYRDLLAY